MKYVMLIMDTPNEPAPGTPEFNAWFAEVGAWYEKWGATGKLEAGHQLQPAATAKTIRGAAVTDGPFIETKEFLVGVIVVEADNLDAALAIAQELQDTRTSGAIEVRPILEALFHGA